MVLSSIVRSGRYTIAVTVTDSIGRTVQLYHTLTVKAAQTSRQDARTLSVFPWTDYITKHHDTQKHRFDIITGNFVFDSMQKEGLSRYGVILVITLLFCLWWIIQFCSNRIRF